MRCAVTPRVSYLGSLHPRVALGQRILIGLAAHEVRIISPILSRLPPHSEAGALCSRFSICVLHGRALWYKGFCLWPNGAGSCAKGFWSKLLLAFMASGLKMPVGEGFWCKELLVQEACGVLSCQTFLLRKASAFGIQVLLV